MAKKKKPQNRHFVADPISGDYLDIGEAFERANEYIQKAHDLSREISKSWRNLNRSKGQDTRAKWLDRYQKAATEAHSYRDAVDKIADVLDRIPVDDVAVEPPEKPPTLKSTDRAKNEEWEMGLMYRAVEAGHDVDVNLRVRRRDGGRMSKQEAHDAFETWIASGDDLDGYEVFAIDWKRPNWDSSAADQGLDTDVNVDGPNLFGPMFTALKQNKIRLGWVKSGEEDDE